MGNLFSDLNNKNLYNTVEFDYKNAEPSEETRESFEEAERLIGESNDILKMIDDYIDCTELIQIAFEFPDDEEKMNKVITTVSERVAVNKELCNFCKKADKTIEKYILTKSSKNNNDELILAKEQAYVIKMATFLSKVLELDEKKMSKPELQNDLAFYRRILPKVKEEDQKITKTDVNEIISFLATHMSVLSKIAKNLNEKNIANALNIISQTAEGLYQIVSAKKFPVDSDLNLVFLRAMVACVILYDGMKIGGVFTKTSELNIKPIIKYLLKDPDGVLAKVEGEGVGIRLANTLRYGCKNENYRNAPYSIVSLYDD